MNQQSAQAVPAPFDNLETMLAKAQEEFAVTRSNFMPNMTKKFYERVVSGEAHKYHGCTIRSGEVTLALARQWLDQVQIVAGVLGIEPSIGGDYDATIEAYFHKRVPYEPEEVELAKHYLETGQYEEPVYTNASWRPPLPFKDVDNGS